MRLSQAVAICLCIAFVLAAGYGWYLATSEFNPNPPKVGVQGSCSASYCGRFGVVDANLTVINATQEDILSQYVGMGIVPSGNQKLLKVGVLLDNVSLGYEEGPFPEGSITSFELGVPTSILLNANQTYSLSVGGYYQNPASSQTTGVVWVELYVVASG